MPRKKFTRTSQYEVDELFKTRIEQHHKCWLWTPSIFRFRHGDIIFNPRTYAAIMEGYVIPPGRYIINNCNNPRCVNPEHTVLKHNGAKLTRNFPVYFTDNDMSQYITRLRKLYHLTEQEVSEARYNTLKLISEIKRNGQSITYYSRKFDLSPSYVASLKKIDKLRFDIMKAVPVDPDECDDDHLTPDADDFKL